MRLVVIALALLASLKVWNNERLYRSATEEALVAAYREQATSACRKDAARQLTGAAAAAAPMLWARPSEVSLVIGKPRLDVAMWDVDNPQWAERYKKAFLVLKPSDKATEAVCAFDVLSGRAEIVADERG